MVTTRQKRDAPKRYHEETNNRFVARKLQKAEEDADWLAVIAAIKAANEAKAEIAEYHRRMEAWNRAQSGYDSDGYANDSDDGCEAGMCNDGSCPFCCDDCHGC
jgi:hypothetical protein